MNYIHLSCYAKTFFVPDIHKHSVRIIYIHIYTAQTHVKAIDSPRLKFFEVSVGHCSDFNGCFKDPFLIYECTI